MRVKPVTEGPLFRDDGPLGKRMLRRVRGISLELVAFVLVTVLFPVLIVAAALVDLVLWLKRRKHWMAVRLVAFAWWFLFGEIRATVAMLGDLACHRRAVRARLAAAHAAGSTRCGSAGPQPPRRGPRCCSDCASRSRVSTSRAPGPIVIMMRHASIIDNLLARRRRRHGRTGSACAT